jgi:hypothetical protein
MRVRVVPRVFDRCVNLQGDLVEAFDVIDVIKGELDPHHSAAPDTFWPSTRASARSAAMLVVFLRE